jgi:hypothetical protein
MTRTFCDCCEKDLIGEEEAWAMQYGEIVNGNNSLIMHFCQVCAKAVLKSVEMTIKKKAESNGKS